MDATLDFHEKNLVDTPTPTHVKSWIRPCIYIMKIVLGLQESFFKPLLQEVKIAPPNLFLGSKPQVRALTWLGTKWENNIRFTVVRSMGPTSTQSFLTHYSPSFTIEREGLYIGYMGNRERDIQTIGPNLNALGLQIQWIGLLGPNIIWIRLLGPNII